MNIGLPQELLHIDWIADLKLMLEQMNPEMVFVHVSDGEAPAYLNLEEDSCFPFKKMIRNALILHKHVDALLLPRVVEMDGFLACPNFRAFPDIVELNTKNIPSNEKKPIVSPIIEVKNNKELKTLAKTTAKDLNGIFNFTSSPKQTVITKNNQDQANLKKIDFQDQDLSKTIAIIGHPYILADKRLNNGVPETLHLYGYNTVFSNNVPFEKSSKLAGSLDYFAKKMYWRSAREIIGAFLFFSRINRAAGIIHLAPFNCGIDALLRIELMSIHKKIEGAPPFMTIVCDEHTQRDHVVTRIEAFLDMIYGIRVN
jgi:predicted nucleotide-binding protein (sugar kinase/HSP70/actin superfamily)